MAGGAAAWLRRAFGARTTGYPTSSNRASSFHLRWQGLPDVDLVEVSAVLEVVVAPTVDELYFWALQASFADGFRPVGAGHLGLQWYRAHPGSTAVNWGGYDSGGRELTGTVPPLSSATGNPNTRDLAWRPGRPYQLTVGRGGRAGAWQGSVDGRPVRELAAGGRRLVDVMVWSEVFARCDDPSVSVQWSDFSARTAAGERVRPEALVVSFQARADGGCDNTDVQVHGGVAQQTTNTARTVRPGTVLPL